MLAACAGPQHAVKRLPAWVRVRIQALALLEGPQVDDGGDVGLNGADPERLPDGGAVCGRPPLHVPRGPDLSSQHAVVEEPDHLIFGHELAVFEALIGAEFLDGGRHAVSREVSPDRGHPPFSLLGVVRPVRFLGAQDAPCAKSSTSRAARRVGRVGSRVGKGDEAGAGGGGGRRWGRRHREARARGPGQKRECITRPISRPGGPRYLGVIGGCRAQDNLGYGGAA